MIQEALKLALKALNAGEHAQLIMNTDGIKDKVRQAIAELESQEPVCPDCKAKVLYECVACSSNNYPPQRTWVGLTDEEAQWIYDNGRTPSRMMEMVEAKLKEKNT
jgi:hypothetical protein